MGYGELNQAALYDYYIGSTRNQFVFIEEKSSMENKITQWCVFNNSNQYMSRHPHRADAVKAAETVAANNPGHRYFVCKLEPVAMSVTSNVTTKDL